MLTQENITMVIQDLAQFINDTVSSPVDHTRENLNETATILTIIADHVKYLTIVDDVVRGDSAYQGFIQRQNFFGGGGGRGAQQVSGL